MSATIDVLLVYPLPTKDSPGLATPLSILHPGALFKKQGLRVEFFDQRFDPDEMLVDLIKSSREIAVSAMTGHQAAEAADILIRAKQIKPDIVTAVGGPHAHILPDQVLGEPFVDKVYSEKAYGNDLFPFDVQTKKHYARTEMMYLTSTGCPYACRYCAQRWPFWPRPIPSIDRELSQVHDEVGFRHVSFCDPNMTHFMYVDENGDKQKIDAVARVHDIGKILRRLDVSCDCTMRVPNITPEMVEALVRANCTRLFLGCESGSDRVLRKVALKGHGVDAIRQAVLNLRGSGISTLYSFMGFMEGETPDDLRQTMDLIDWITETDEYARVSVYHYTPYPGTPMYEDAVSGKYGRAYVPPTSMKGWAERRLMNSPLYWIAGLNFRMDNTQRNFPGEDWALIEPYVTLARKLWRERDIMDFPCAEVETLIGEQLARNRNRRAEGTALPQ